MQRAVRNRAMKDEGAERRETEMDHIRADSHIGYKLDAGRGDPGRVGLEAGMLCPCLGRTESGSLDIFISSRFLEGIHRVAVAWPLSVVGVEGKVEIPQPRNRERAMTSRFAGRPVRSLCATRLPPAAYILNPRARTLLPFSEPRYQRI